MGDAFFGVSFFFVCHALLSFLLKGKTGLLKVEIDGLIGKTKYSLNRPEKCNLKSISTNWPLIEHRVQHNVSPRGFCVLFLFLTKKKRCHILYKYVYINYFCNSSVAFWRKKKSKITKYKKKLRSLKPCEKTTNFLIIFVLSSSAFSREKNKIHTQFIFLIYIYDQEDGIKLQ